MELGPLMKKIRQERGITLRELSARTGLTASLVSQVENGKVLPSLGSLRAVLACLGTPLSDFFRQVERKDHILVRKAEAETRTDLLPGITLTLYASKLECNSLISYGVTMNPRVELELTPQAPELNGERFLLVEGGRLEAALGDAAYALESGDSLNFKSHLACRLRNPDTRRPCRFFLNGPPPLFG